MKNEQLKLYGEIISLPINKVEINSIRIRFFNLASDWNVKVKDTFYTRFLNPDDLYNNIDILANEIRSDAIKEGIKFLASHEIFHIAEKLFYEKFMSLYDSWDEDSDVVLSQYEAIMEQSSELDAYRTARRKSRKQMIGFGSYAAIKHANFSNNFDNMLHGAFNLAAKGITAIGNSIKKDEIYKSVSTLEQVTIGCFNIVIAAFHATVDAINSEHEFLLHNYTAEEISKSEAITENIIRGIVPEEKILSSLIKAIETYPYNRDIYVLLLTHYGADEYRLDAVVSTFGLKPLADEKDGLFEKKCNSLNFSTVVDCKKNIPILRDYAKKIGYAYSDQTFPSIEQQAIENDFYKKIAEYNITTTNRNDSTIKEIELYVKNIGYIGFDKWLNQTQKEIESRMTAREEEKRNRTIEIEVTKSRQMVMYLQKTIAAVGICIITLVIYSKYIASAREEEAHERDIKYFNNGKSLTNDALKYIDTQRYSEVRGRYKDAYQVVGVLIDSRFLDEMCDPRNTYYNSYYCNSQNKDDAHLTLVVRDEGSVVNEYYNFDWNIIHQDRISKLLTICQINSTCAIKEIKSVESYDGNFNVCSYKEISKKPDHHLDCKVNGDVAGILRISS